MAEQSVITVDCPECQTGNSVSNHFCKNCNANMEQAVFGLYEQLIAEQNKLLKDGKVAQAEAVIKKEKQVLAAYGAMTKKDYRVAARNFLIASSIILPVQIVLLIIVINLRNNSHSTANTIFLDGIIFSGIANILAFFAALSMFVNSRRKGSL